MKYFILFFLLCCNIIYSENINKLPHPYCDIKVLPPNHTGFFINQNILKELIQEYNIKIIVELGSWLGASSIFMARLLPEDGLLYAVDH